MKDCPHCVAQLFDDQDFCYECSQPLYEAPESISPGNNELMACIEVTVGDSFTYEARLRKTEGASLSVGSACENAIVIPQPEVQSHELDIFYSQGYLWVEERGTGSCTLLNGTPLRGTRNIQPGARITMGNTCLSLV